MEWTAVVDRFEGDLAVLEFSSVGSNEEEHLMVAVPRSLLPKTAKEGDFLKVTWEIDYEKTKSAREEIASILERLANRSQER
ncbi:MAG: DUF3006 domain-containing protein [Firmicutes bacterium]|jgi:hypothetical protein|nr:DUF3006 domain-containing protein [Bacillota bacterium]NLL89009.1 DUF3006 domain-containing protein [Bacillota bacterium]HKM17543.1 DUF3006 domain-containing protein [Limnochordia bacterium]